MKWSMFNYVVQGDKYTIVKNSRTLSTIRITKELYNILKNNNFDIPEQTLQLLVDNGFVALGDEGALFVQEIENTISDSAYYVITIAPTLMCNFGCTYCYEAGLKAVNAENSEYVISAFRNIVHEIKDNSHNPFIRIILFGGEPTLVPTPTLNIISDIIQKYDIPHSIDVITNGYNASDSFIEWCKENNIENIQITIDGPQPFHDSTRCLRDGSNTFDRIFGNIALFLQPGVTQNIIVRINCTNDNIDSIPFLLDQIKYTYEKDIHRFLFSFGQLGFGDNQHANAYVKEKNGQSEFFFQKYAHLFHYARKVGFDVPSEYAVGDICSNKRKGSVVIAPNGLYKCMRSIGRMSRKLPSDDYKAAYMKNELYSDCFSKACPYIPYCHNGCLFSASLVGKTKTCRREELDTINKYMLKYMFEEE